MGVDMQRRSYGASAALQSTSQQGDQKKSVVEQDEEYSSLSDKVTPVSAPEATGWSVLILGAYGISAALAYTVFTQLFLRSPEVEAFDHALETVRKDFRVTVRLGENIKGYGGTGAGSRQQRQHISHRIYDDSKGMQHVQVQFNISGQGQRGVVSADMYKETGVWQYAYLFVDLSGTRIVLEPLRQ